MVKQTVRILSTYDSNLLCSSNQEMKPEKNKDGTVTGRQGGGPKCKDENQIGREAGGDRG